MELASLKIFCQFVKGEVACGTRGLRKILFAASDSPRALRRSAELAALKSIFFFIHGKISI